MPGVLDLCVKAVIAEDALDHVIPGFSRREVALVARDALEGIEVRDAIRDRLMIRETRGGDWALAVLAELRFFASSTLRKSGKEALSKEVYDLGLAALEDAAASADRSPIVFYEDIFFEAAQSLVRRGDRRGITRQIECVAESLQDEEAANTLNAMRDLAMFYMDLGEHRTGLALLAALQRHDPSDPWGYNAIAIRIPRHGLPSIAKLAAERALDLVRRNGDPERLTEQLREVVEETGSKVDDSHAPADAIDDLRDALHADFDAVSAESRAQLARRLVPEVATARVKVLPAAPSDEALAETARRLRAVLGRGPGVKPPELRPEAPRPIAGAPKAPKVGRNEPCPCGSGKKYKKCCLT